jgi:hypothetical protein
MTSNRGWTDTNISDPHTIRFNIDWGNDKLNLEDNDNDLRVYDGISTSQKQTLTVVEGICPPHAIGKGLHPAHGEMRQSASH